MANLSDLIHSEQVVLSARVPAVRDDPVDIVSVVPDVPSPQQTALRRYSTPARVASLLNDISSGATNTRSIDQVHNAAEFIPLLMPEIPTTALPPSYFPLNRGSAEPRILRLRRF